MTDALAPLLFASALSTAPTPERAAGEALQTLGPRLEGAADVVVVFASPHHGEGLLDICNRLRAGLNADAAIACTCDGVIGVRHEVEGGPGLSVLAGRLPGVTVEPFSGADLGMPAAADHPAILHEAMPRTRAAGGAKALLLLADPFSTPLVRLLPAFDEAFPGVPLVGGLASAGRQPRQNHLVVNDRLLKEGTAGLALSGPLSVQTTVSQGCRPIGEPFVITRSKRHVIQELGGINALEAVQLMAQDLPEPDRDLLQHNGVFIGRVINEYKSRFGRGDFLVRNVIGVDGDSGYIAINDPQVRIGQTVQVHVRDADTAAEDLDLLLQAQRIHGPGAGALLFSCASRGRKLFERPNADAEAIHAALGDVPLAGFFAAGEIGPVAEQTFIHGHTASLAVFRRT